jgi:hypothetical protein
MCIKIANGDTKTDNKLPGYGAAAMRYDWKDNVNASGEREVPIRQRLRMTPVLPERRDISNSRPNWKVHPPAG